MLKQIHKIFEKAYGFVIARTNMSIVFFFIYALFLIAPFLYSGPNVPAGNDYHWHHLIVHNIGLAFDGGQIPPRVMPDVMGFGFGYGTGIFYSQLPHFVTWVISRLPLFNVHSAITAVFFLCYFFSGYTFYKMMRYMGKTESAAVIGGLLFMSLPYHIMDVFYNNALSQMFCSILLPLVLMGFLKLVREQKIMILVLSFSAIVLSHNITALYTFLFLVAGCLVYARSFMNRRVFVAGIKAAVLVLLLTAFFTVPIMEHVFFNAHGDGYQAFALGDNLRNFAVGKALHVAQLFYWPFGHAGFANHDALRNGSPVFIGAHLILLFVVAVLWPSSRKNLRANTPFILAALALVFATTIYFPWRSVPYIFLNVQYPARLLSGAGFFICIVAADVFSRMSARETRLSMIVIALVGMFYTTRIASILPIRPKFTEGDVSLKGNRFYGNYNSVAGGEYLPKKVRWNNQAYLNWPKTPYTLWKRVTLSGFRREKNGRFSFDIDSDVRDEIGFPIFYYMGYEIKFTPVAGGPTRVLDYYENHSGFVTTGNPGKGSVKVRYKGTAADRTATIISFLTLFLIICYAVVPARMRRKIFSRPT